MRIAYLDCYCGISGDMFLGAAVDAGVRLEKLRTVAAALGLGAELVARRVERGGIWGTKVDVLIDGRVDQPLDLETAHGHEDEHIDGHGHRHESQAAPAEHADQHATHRGEHGHKHESHAEHVEPAEHAAHGQHAHPSHVHRGLPEIREIIAGAPVSGSVKAFALKTFGLLAEAEGKVHNSNAESIHFHEVGSEDAIVDIVCAGVVVEAIGADAWYCSALNVGGGTVRCAHGTLPVPAPATAELLRGAPVFSSGIQKELLTPTGAAILRALEVCFEPLPTMTLTASGYGAGGRDFPGVANLLRISIGQAATRQAADVAQAGGAESDGAETDTVIVLEANIDDMNPQLFSYVQQKLLAAGALDAFAIPVQMKKGRPGLLFTVLAAPGDAEGLSRILLTESTTLGVRMRQEQRRILQRRHVRVESCWGPIRVKLGLLQGEVVNCAPEFEDCRKIAEANGVPLKTVLQEALRLYQAPAAGSNALPNCAPAGDAPKSS